MTAMKEVEIRKRCAVFEDSTYYVQHHIEKFLKALRKLNGKYYLLELEQLIKVLN